MPLYVCSLTNRYGQGSGRIHYSEITCSNNDIHLLHCAVNNAHRCTHISDVAVVCGKLYLYIIIVYIIMLCIHIFSICISFSV